MKIKCTILKKHANSEICTWNSGKLCFAEFRGIVRNLMPIPTEVRMYGSTKFPAEFRTEGIPWTPLFWLSCSNSSILVVLFWLSRSVLAVLFSLYCSGCPLPTVLPWLSCPCCIALPVLFRLPSSNCPALAVLSLLYCSACPVLAALVQCSVT